MFIKDGTRISRENITIIRLTRICLHNVCDHSVKEYRATIPKIHYDVGRRYTYKFMSCEYIKYRMYVCVCVYFFTSNKQMSSVTNTNQLMKYSLNGKNIVYILYG